MDAEELLKKLEAALEGPMYKFIPWWEDDYDNSMYWYNLFKEKDIAQVEACVAKCSKDDLEKTSGATGLSLLHLLVWQNFYAAVEKILNRDGLGIDLNITDGGGKGLTPLMLACCRANLAMAKLLTEHGASSAQCDAAGRNAYHYLGRPWIRELKNSNSNLCERMSMEQREPIARLLSDGINAVDSGGLTPFACMLVEGRDSGCSSVLTEVFLEKGATVDYVDSAGNTMLMIAVRKGHMTAAVRLAERGDFVNTPNLVGETPMQLAMRCHNEGLCMVLKDCGAKEEYDEEDVDMINMSRITSNAFTGAALDNGRDDHALALHLTKILFSRIDLSDGDDLKYFTMILYPALMNDKKCEVLDMCREVGIDFTAPIYRGNAVLCIRDECLGANYGVGVIKKLIGFGVDMNAAFIDGKTPANVVASKGYREDDRYFEEAARIFSKESMEWLDDYGIAAVHRAAENGHVGMLKVMLEKGVDMNLTQDRPAEAGNTPLHVACIYGCGEVVRFLEDSGADDTMRNINGELAAHHAVMEKKDGGALDVKERAAVLRELKTVDGARNDGKTPLMLLQLLDTSTTLRLLPILIGKGVNLNAADLDGNTALLWQTKTPNRCDKEVVKKLVAAGADVNMANNDGNTALHFALKLGSQEVARFLINKGADYNRVNNNGVSCAQIAVESGYHTILGLMTNIR